MAVASAVVLRNGNESDPVRAASRAASEATPTVSQRRLTSNVANSTMNSAGMRMTNSTIDEPRSRHRRPVEGITISSHLKRAGGGAIGPPAEAHADIDARRL